MSQSEQINEIAAALSKAQKAIKGAVKGKENDYFKSSYADLAAVMEACRDALSDNGIAVSQVTDFLAEGNQPLTMWLETKLIHSSGQWLSGRYPIQPIKQDPQGYGSAITYARRYGLMAAAGIVADSEDDDGEGAMGRQTGVKPIAPAPKKPEPAPKPTDEARKAAAEKWGNAAIEKLAAMKSMKDFDKWHTQDVRDRIAAIKNYDTALHTAILASIDRVLDKFNPIGS